MSRSIKFVFEIHKILIPDRYFEDNSNPSSSSSHLSDAKSWSLVVVANMQAPWLTRNSTIGRLLQEAAQCNGVLVEKNEGCI